LRIGGLIEATGVAEQSSGFGKAEKGYSPANLPILSAGSINPKNTLVKDYTGGCLKPDFGNCGRRSGLIHAKTCEESNLNTYSDPIGDRLSNQSDNGVYQRRAAVINPLNRKIRENRVRFLENGTTVFSCFP
jgi:hypothetical protein